MPQNGLPQNGQPSNYPQIVAAYVQKIVEKKIAEEKLKHSGTLPNVPSPAAGESYPKGPTSSSTSSGKPDVKPDDEDDPVITNGVHKSDIVRMMALQAVYSKIMKSPAMKNFANGPQVAAAFQTMMGNEMKGMLGKLLGEGNVQTLYDAMAGNLYQGRSKPTAAQPQGANKPPAQQQGGAMGAAAYAQKLSGLQDYANKAAGQLKRGEVMNTPYGGDPDMPEWFSHLKQMPVEQQLSLLGIQQDPGSGEYVRHEVDSHDYGKTPYYQNSIPDGVQLNADRTFSRGPKVKAGNPTTI